jgi:Fe-Mn family superoxide dismutase
MECDDSRAQAIQAEPLTRRDFVTAAGLGAAAVGLLDALPALAQPGPRRETKGDASMPHVLPDLPYAYDALEPYYDEQTVRLHHDIHHAGYVKGLNAAEEKVKAMLESGDFGAAKAVCADLAFHGSGHILHSLFWPNMKPGGGGEPTGELADAIGKAFGSFDAFKGLFLAVTNGVAGSGWGVLAYRKPDDALVVLQAGVHENLTQWGVTPLLVCDVWEHAYYLKYQNKRAEWTKTFLESLVNWDNVAENLAKAKG